MQTPNQEVILKQIQDQDWKPILEFLYANNKDHKSWVLNLANRLVKEGVNVLLDIN